jgi:hypothetical protein
MAQRVRHAAADPRGRLFIEDFVKQEIRELGLTQADLNAWAPTAPARRKGGGKRAAGKVKAINMAAGDSAAGGAA